MIIRMHTLSLLVVPVLMLGGGIVLAEPEDATVSREVISYQPYAPTYCAKCEDCNPQPGQEGHVVFPFDEAGFNATHEHQCLGPWSVAAGACTVHEGCAEGGGGSAFAAPRPTDEELDALFADPVANVATVLAMYPETVQFNVVRGALQFVGCSSGTLVGNLTLDSRQLASLGLGDDSAAE
jgi:hypothetical protein